MIHGHVLVEAHVEGSGSVGDGEGFLTELITPYDGSRSLAVVKGGELLIHAGEGQQCEQARREYC